MVLVPQASPSLCVITSASSSLEAGECPTASTATRFLFNATALDRYSYKGCTAGGRCGQLQVVPAAGGSAPPPASAAATATAAAMCMSVSLTLETCVSPADAAGSAEFGKQTWVLGASGRVFPGDKKATHDCLGV